MHPEVPEAKSLLKRYIYLSIFLFFGLEHLMVAETCYAGVLFELNWFVLDSFGDGFQPIDRTAGVSALETELSYCKACTQIPGPG